MLSDLEIDRIAERIIAAIGASRCSKPSDDEMVDIHGAAKLLGCSVATIERRTKEGALPSVKFGRLRRYRRADLLALNKKGGCDER
jgi:excisionase family DNA binding protein